MKQYTLKTGILDVVLFVITFALIQFVVELAACVVYSFVNHTTYALILQQLQQGKLGALLASTTVISSLLTILVFARLRWSPLTRTYLRSRPWGVLCWAALLALGTILPLEWLYERMQMQIDPSMQNLYQSIMKESWGYLAIGVLAPIAEEVVFRGGVLRVLLQLTGARRHWVAIAISALIFAAIHLNLAQGVHAFIIGLILGWMYYRTGSIVPGIVVHWVNNSVAYLMFALMPQMADGKLIDLFHGSHRTMWLGILFSLCILIPSLLQLAQRMRRPND